MKKGTLRAFIVTTSLIAGTAMADDKITTDTKGDTKSGVGKTADKISQGVKNMVTELKLEDLPAPVQKTVREQSQGAKINDIDREDRTGRTVYEIEFATEGANREIHVASDGTLLTEDQAGLQLGWDRKTDSDRTLVREKSDKNLKFSDLPAPVQAAVRQHGTEDTIADIDTYTRNGKRMYEVEFSQKGLNRDIHVSEDGTVMDNDTAVGAPGTDRGATEGRDRSRTEPTGNGAPTPAQPVK